MLLGQLTFVLDQSSWGAGMSGYTLPFNLHNNDTDVHEIWDHNEQFPLEWIIYECSTELMSEKDKMVSHNVFQGPGENNTYNVSDVMIKILV